MAASTTAEFCVSALSSDSMAMVLLGSWKEKGKMITKIPNVENLWTDYDMDGNQMANKFK